MSQVNFDDVNIGDEIPTQYFQPDQISIWKYGAASGDLNPIHMGTEYGVKAGLGGTIAHGLSTMARAGRCVTDWAGNPAGLKKLKTRFKAPVKPGDKVTFKGKVIDKRVEGGVRLVTVQIEAVNQDGILILGKCEATIELP